jgi:3',5'-nucleoside bisphosphate phosphatase
MIDLHTHTNFSDGTSTPADLLVEAEQAGLSAVAITDHDTLAGFDAALPLAARHYVEIVCGVEVSTQLEMCQGLSLPVHLLGYFFNEVPGDDFRHWLAGISATRYERNMSLMKKLQAANIEISWEDFPDLGPKQTARPGIARVLVKKGYAATYQSAFDLYLSDSALEKIKRSVPSTQEAIKRISGSGGIAVLAHPMRIRGQQIPECLTIIQELVRCGLGGLEIYHSDHSTEDAAFLQQAAERFRLVPTGGSDYHGENKPGVRLGSGRQDNIAIPDSLLQRIKDVFAPPR